MSRLPLPLGGPFFEDLAVGGQIDNAPALTLTDGHAAVHQSILGHRLRLPLDTTLSERVLQTGGRALAHPALVWDVAIGQSTLATQRVIANLFYRGLVLRRFPLIGDTLQTRTDVAALRQNRPRPGRPATGLAVLRIRTVDQQERPVLDFWRCAMLPLRDPEGDTGHADELDVIPADLDPATLRTPISDWNLGAFRAALPSPPAPARAEGVRWAINGGDVVSSAPELARLTLNIATVHHDETSTGQRLVYGGHTIGLAAAQLSRALPDLVTVIAWHSCDHLAPVFEGDTLRTDVELERLEPLPGGGALTHLRARVVARRRGAGNGPGAPDATTDTEVLDWRLVGLLA